LRAAAITVFQIAIVAGLTLIDDTISTVVMRTMMRSRQRPALARERRCNADHIAGTGID
jgi:hypothetical protein